MGRNELPDLGAAIGRRRLARGMTMDDLAARAGLSVNTIRNAIQGAPPNIVNLAAIASALGTTVGELLGENAAPGIDPRLAGVVALAPALTDSDIEALTITARQLASARAAALPPRADIPGWDQMTPQEQRAYEEAEALVRRVSRLRVAEPSATYGAGATRGSGGRAGGGRSPGGEARAQVQA